MEQNTQLNVLNELWDIKKVLLGKLLAVYII